MDKANLEKICTQIDLLEEESIKLQKELTARPALSPENGGTGEREKADFLRGYLQELNCEINEYNAPDDRVPDGYRPNLVARILGENHNRTFWILSHMDVVPPGDLSKWESDPWQARVNDGKIYGRGTEDNQQGIVSSLIAARAFRDAGIQPKYDIGLIFVSDEETGNLYGIQHLVKNHRVLFKDADFIIAPDAGNPDGTLVEVAEKSIVWFKFTTEGGQTHASTPEMGVNAFRAGSALVIRLNDLYKIYDKSDPVFDPPISTFEPTKKEPNVENVNTIPGEDIFYLDCRVLPDYAIEDLKKKVKSLCEEVEKTHHVKIDVSIEMELIAPPATPADAPVVQSLLRAISDLRNNQPIPQGIGGGTVAAFFRNVGLNAVVWATQDDTLHGANEYAKIENILNDAKVFAHMALQP